MIDELKPWPEFGWIERIPWKEHRKPHLEKFMFRWFGGSWCEYWMDKKLIKHMGWENVWDFLEQKQNNIYKGRLKGK